MNRTNQLLVMLAVAASVFTATAAEPETGESPTTHLPPHITQVTWFGERADWAADGKKILFLSKTFGDAMELDLATKTVRNLTAHFPHHGFTRALYLTNGDILLSGPEEFNPKNVHEARKQNVPVRQIQRPRETVMRKMRRQVANRFRGE